MGNVLKFIIPVVVGALGAIAEPVQLWISAHPAIVSVLTALATIIGILLRSPIQPRDRTPQ